MIVFDILHTEAVLLYSLFFICAFENQRWFRSANYSSGFEREFAENTGLVAMVCQYLSAGELKELLEAVERLVEHDNHAPKAPDYQAKVLQFPYIGNDGVGRIKAK